MNFITDMFSSMISSINTSSMISFIISMLFCGVMVCAIFIIMEILIVRKREEKIKGIVRENKAIHNVKNLSALKRFSNSLEIMLKEKDKEGIFSMVFLGVLVFVAFTMIFFISVNQILFAVLAPVIIIKIATELCTKMCADFVENLEEQLPFAIDNIIRISSKHGDIRSIIYEASKTCQNPTRGILENMSREMLSGSPERILMSYAKKYDNVWFYSLIFTLVSYLEDVSKEETIKNLKALRDILEKENYIKKAGVTDKKYSVVVNLSICGMAILGFFLNLLITPNAKEFFFSTSFGLICFVSGISSIIATLFMSIKMTKSNKS